MSIMSILHVQVSGPMLINNIHRCYNPVITVITIVFGLLKMSFTLGIFCGSRPLITGQCLLWFTPGCCGQSSRSCLPTRCSRVPFQIRSDGQYTDTVSVALNICTYKLWLMLAGIRRWEKLVWRLFVLQIYMLAGRAIYNVFTISVCIRLVFGPGFLSYSFALLILN